MFNLLKNKCRGGDDEAEIVQIQTMKESAVSGLEGRCRFKDFALFLVTYLKRASQMSRRVNLR
jgi:hypothetical protein